MGNNNNNIEIVLKFMPAHQAQCFIEGLRGSEHRYYESVLNNMAQVINNAPTIYETDGQGEEVKPVLHYFYGNVDIYITEIDRSGANQHFGYTSLGMGYLENGYICLKHIFQEIPFINLDFHFIPQSISTYKRKHEVA